MVFFLLPDPNVKIIKTAFVNSFLPDHCRNFLAPRTRSPKIKKKLLPCLQKLFFSLNVEDLALNLKKFDFWTSIWRNILLRHDNLFDLKI